MNLGLGVPAGVPLYLAWWLLTKYMPMDCKRPEDLTKPELTNCNYTTLDHASGIMFLLAVTGIFTLAFVAMIDVIIPLQRGRRLAAWLGAATLIPVPFAIFLALA
ncbi:hypothetical protein [Microtetraspora fusca]|uniref:DUF2834 domain-containing protein n=1 Tax=Microtetraspora fusca TaxID=1997 RepID=A0ABW6VHZ5_MICFU|nr:hypothetical protein [Microtetraspora fusca]